MNILLTTLLSSIVLTPGLVSATSEAAPSAVVYFQPPKSTARNHNVNTQDWDLIYKFINKVGISKNSGVKRSQQESQSPITAFGSLLYGLSMAAGLALGVTISESPVLNAFINGMDYRFMTRRSQLDQNQHPLPAQVAPKIAHPQIHRFVAPSKDGKDHYHHVVHYHIPYPLSVGALETARQNYPHISWYGSGLVGGNSGAGHTAKSNSILSGYLGPVYKAPDEVPDKSVQLNDLQASFVDDIRRNDRHDFRVFSEAEYFKNLHRTRGKPQQLKSDMQRAESVPPKITSLEDMLFTDTNNPNLIAEDPNHRSTEAGQNASNVTLTPSP